MNKIETAVKFIGQVASKFRNPAIAWSGGKDSMVMLFLIRKMYESIPFQVIFLHEPFFAEKFNFHQRVAAEWGFYPINLPPHKTTICRTDDTFEFLRHYSISRIGDSIKSWVVPVTPYEEKSESQKHLCGLSDILDRPKGLVDFPWDVLFVGHKSCDRDLMYSNVELNVDLKLNYNAPAFAFPLRHWSDSEIWDCLIDYHVPIDLDRYDVLARAERQNRSLNSDYYRCCTRCLDKNGPAQVFCPKLNYVIDNISNQVEQSDPPQLAYFGKQGASK